MIEIEKPTIEVVEVSEDGKYGKFVRFTKIESESGDVFNGNEYTSLNFWAFPKEFMETLGTQFDEFLSKNSKDAKAEFYLPFAVDTAIKTGIATAKILPTEERWQGVTYREDMGAVEKFLQENGRI